MPIWRRNLSTNVIFAAAGVALGLLWVARRQPAALSTEAVTDDEPVRVRVVPPSRRNSFDDEPALTAAPHELLSMSQRAIGADDYEALGPDELSAAFLSRATESGSPLGPDESGVEAELPGFQIATIDELVRPAVRDDPADFELPDPRPKPRTSG